MIMTPQKKNIIQFACFSGAVVGLILILIAVVLMFSKSDEGIIPTLLGTSSQGDTLLEESETNDSSETPSATESDPDPDPDPTPDLPPEESSDGNGGGSSSSGGSSTQQVKPVKAVVKTVNGMPQLYINNKLTMPILFFGNTDRNDRYDITTHEARLAAAGGIRLHTMISNLNYSDLTNPKLLYMDYLNDCNTIIEGDPSAKIMVRINIGQYNTTGVKDSEIMKFVGGEEKDYKLVSIASDEWFEDAKKRLADMVKYTRSSPELADHVFGWHLENGEWFQYMFREAGTDISEANDRKFREWLTDKYKTDAALSKAWGGNYTLATAQVPRDLPNNISSARYSDTLLLKDTQTRFVDYLDYVGWLVSSRIEGLAKTIKEASNNENIVISFYGYFYELCDAQSGHFSMRPLLESEYLDGFASPVTYGDRSGGLSSGGATSAYMTAVESVARNGKIWFSESDQRTYISRGGDPLDTFCTPIMSISAIQEVHKREIGSNMVHGTGMYAMDLTANGWLDDSRIWKNIGKLSKLNLAYVNARKKAPEFEVALVVDEKAESIVGDPVALSFQTLSQARYNLYRAGVRFSMVELEDVLNGKANEYKVYIFANPYRLSSETVEKLNSRIHRDNKISVFMYSFGRTSAADVKKLTGMDINVQTGTQNLKLTINQNKIAGLNGSTAEYSFNPRTVITGGQSAVLGTYNDGSTGMAMYEGSNYKTIFCGVPCLTSEQIRAIANYAGAEVFLDTNDVVVANEELIVFNTTTSGDKVIQFREKTDVYDYFENKWYQGVTSITFKNMEAEQCKYLFYGKKSEIEAKNLPVWEK